MADYSALQVTASNLENPAEAIKLVKKPIPTPGPGDVLVRLCVVGKRRQETHCGDGRALNLPSVPSARAASRSRALKEPTSSGRVVPNAS